MAVARISRHDPLKQGRFRVTTGNGDAIKDISVPCIAALYFPPDQSAKNLLGPSVDGLDPRGSIVPVKILRTNIGTDKGTVDLKYDGDPESAKGAWICIDKNDLIRAGKGIYYFQIVGMDVKLSMDGETLGQIISIFDTSAHGILTIRMEDQKEILVPLVDEYVTLNLEKNCAIIPSIHDFDLQ